MGPNGQRSQVRAAWWQEKQDEVMNGFIVEPQKTKVEPGLRGGRVMSGHLRRLHRVRRVSGGLPENNWVP
jgi:hypothetical protein